MPETETRPSTPFLKFLNIMDEQRRRSFREITASQLQSMMGLTVRQSAALREVKALTEDSPAGISLKTVAKALQMTMPATSLLVDAMVGKGFFVRDTNPNDRRAICIRLSDKGQQLFSDIFSRLQEYVDRVVQDLTVEEMTVMNEVVDKMTYRLNG